MKSWFGALPYFTAEELADRGDDYLRLDMRFAAALPALRLAAGHPLVLTSCCRTHARNALIGGHPRSLHVGDHPHHATHGCMAADVSTWQWGDTKRDRFVTIARDLGWSIGFGKTFLHVDRRIEIGMQRADFEY